MSIKFIHSMEQWSFSNPLAEPEIEWEYPDYNIERVVNEEGIIWFGQGTNWVKAPDKGWTMLGTDESVQPLEPGGCVYPEGRNIWIPCEEPIYEALRREFFNNLNTI